MKFDRIAILAVVTILVSALDSHAGWVRQRRAKAQPQPAPTQGCTAAQGCAPAQAPVQALVNPVPPQVLVQPVPTPMPACQT